MTEQQLEQRAIHEAITLVPYDSSWPQQFDAERMRLAAIAPELLAIEHIGSTAVSKMLAKPVIDVMAAVPSMAVADELVDRLCQVGAGAGGYITSSEFNRSLGDRRWLMRHAGGRRTHHLHLVPVSSSDWADCIQFRDALRSDAELAKAYVQLKTQLAKQFKDDREAYTAAKSAFITAARSR